MKNVLSSNSCRLSLAFALLMLCVFTLPGYAATPDEEREEALAYSLCTHAYTFGFPWVYLSQLRYMWTQVSPPEGALIPYAAVNTFYQADRLKAVIGWRVFNGN